VTPQAEEAALAAIRRDYPGWTFEYARDAQVWIAVQRPPQRPEHILAAETLGELRAKLEQAR
jgi:hypothetical protein